MELNTGLEAAIEKAGGVKPLADLMGESIQTILNWRARGVPANKCVALEAHTGVDRREFREDWRDYWPQATDSELPA